MELELGLALPNHSSMMIQGLDLNCNDRYNGLEKENREDYSKKRVFLEDHGVGVEGTTLSLLSWSGGRRHPEAEEEDGGRQPNGGKLQINIHDDDEECGEMEGWAAMKSSWQEAGGGDSTKTKVMRRKSMHVKVKMEGVAIGRKVHLRDCDSYPAFTNALIHMFAKYSKIERDWEDYTFLYQDREGDWLLVGDVQWGVFVESVQRVEILKNENRMGFQLLSRKT